MNSTKTPKEWAETAREDLDCSGGIRTLAVQRRVDIVERVVTAAVLAERRRCDDILTGEIAAHGAASREGIALAAARSRVARP